MLLNSADCVNMHIIVRYQIKILQTYIILQFYIMCMNNVTLM